MFEIEILITDLMANRWQEPIDIAKKLNIHSLINVTDKKLVFTNKISISKNIIETKQKDINRILSFFTFLGGKQIRFVINGEIIPDELKQEFCFVLKCYMNSLKQNDINSYCSEYKKLTIKDRVGNPEIRIWDKNDFGCSFCKLSVYGLDDNIDTPYYSLPLNEFTTFTDTKALIDKEKLKEYILSSIQVAKYCPHFQHEKITKNIDEFPSEIDKNNDKWIFENQKIFSISQEGENLLLEVNSLRKKEDI